MQIHSEFLSKNQFWTRSLREWTKSRHLGYPADRVSPRRFPPLLQSIHVGVLVKCCGYKIMLITYTQRKDGLAGCRVQIRRVDCNLRQGVRALKATGPQGTVGKLL